MIILMHANKLTIIYKNSLILSTKVKAKRTEKAAELKLLRYGQEESMRFISNNLKINYTGKLVQSFLKKRSGHEE